MKELLSSFNLNGHTLEFNRQNSESLSRGFITESESAKCVYLSPELSIQDYFVNRVSGQKFLTHFDQSCVGTFTRSWRLASQTRILE